MSYLRPRVLSLRESEIVCKHLFDNIGDYGRCGCGEYLILDVPFALRTFHGLERFYTLKIPHLPPMLPLAFVATRVARFQNPVFFGGLG